jgi:hypothetical protein
MIKLNYLFFLLFTLKIQQIQSNPYSVLFINYQNECGEQCVKDLFWFSSYGVNNIFNESSNYSVSFDYSSSKFINIDNYPPVIFDLCLDTTNILSNTSFDLVRQQNIEPENFDFQMILIPSYVRICEWNTKSYIYNCSSTFCYSIINSYNPASFSHALAHNLGLKDSANQSYYFTDYSTIMSYNSEPIYYYTQNLSNSSFFNGYQRFYLGWLNPEYQLKNPKNNTVVNITQLYYPIDQLETQSILMVTNNLDLGNVKYNIYIEYRSNNNFDTNLIPELQNKIIVHAMTDMRENRIGPSTIFDNAYGEKEVGKYHSLSFAVLEITQNYALIFIGECQRNFPTIQTFISTGNCLIYFLNNNNEGCVNNKDKYFVPDIFNGNRYVDNKKSVVVFVNIPNNEYKIYNGNYQHVITVEINQTCDIVQIINNPSTTNSPTNSFTKSFTKSPSRSRSRSKPISRSKTMSRTVTKTISKSRTRTKSSTKSKLPRIS